MDLSKISVLHVTSYSYGAIGGPLYSGIELIRRQHRQGLAVALLTKEPRRAYRQDEPFPVFGGQKLSYRGQIQGLPAPFCRPSLIHFNSFYEWRHALLAREAERLGIPYIISPRGALNAVARSYRKYRKLLAYWAFQKRVIKKAAALHCLTRGEADQARGWGPPVFIVPNGTDLAVPAPGPAADATDPAAELRGLYLGRIDIFIKGLDLLVDGLALFCSRHRQSPLRLSLVGPDWRADSSRLGALAERRGLRGLLTLADPILPEAKGRLFPQYHFFMHTSRTEGHPLAVVEALAHGLPCFLTPQTNMAEAVAEAGAGWCVEPTPAAIAEGFQKVLEERARLPEMGRAARQLALREFDWDRNAQAMIRHYLEIIERAEVKRI
jgi:glycosyltransferase involved in cell wall biosynthesis